MATRPKTRSSLNDKNLEESGDSDMAEKTPQTARRGRGRPRKDRRLSKRSKPIGSSGKEVHETAIDEPPAFEGTKPTVEDLIDADATRYFAYGLSNGVEGKERKKKTKKAAADSFETAPALSLDALRECFNDESKLVQDMRKKLAASYDQWMLSLSEGSNLLLCGYGSKLDLLEDFRRSQLVKHDYTHVVVHGYRPESTVKQLLLTLRTHLGLDSSTTWTSGPHSLVQNTLEIRQALMEVRDAMDFVILIHNIDGLALRDEESQTALSYLAALDNQCRIIASIDHVNASLLWDRTKLNRFRWLHIDATTYANYRREIDGQGSKILGLSKKGGAGDSCHTLDGLKSIWASLNKNSQAIFTKLATCQLKNKGAKRKWNLMTFADLFDSCREDFIISSEAALKQTLVEFQDHHLVKTKLNADEQEVLYVDVAIDLLTEFLNGQGVDVGDQTAIDDSANVTSMDNTADSIENSEDEKESDESGGSAQEDDEMDDDDALDDLAF